MPLNAYANTFAGNPLDRASDHRADTAWLRARLDEPRTSAVAFWNGAPLIATDGEGRRLARLDARLALTLGGDAGDLLFLGLDRATEPARAVFAVELIGPADPAEGPLAGLGRFRGLREAAPLLDAPEAAIAATGRAVFEWRRRHRHCSVCGQPSLNSDGGWRRTCPACGAEHFPRTDPVVIMLPVIGDRCLLGRQATWDGGRFSALAGFLEPGESIEEACAREVLEESGLEVLSVRYHSSQPWPFPSNLMIGLIAEVAEGEATPDQTELEAVRWFTRAELRDLLAGRVEGLSAPPALAIAYHLIKAWAEE